MGKYFSKKRMEPKLKKIHDAFPWASHVGANVSGVVRVFSREPVHFPFGFELPKDLGRSEIICELGRKFPDWEKHMWKIPGNAEAIEEAAEAVDEFGEAVSRLDPSDFISLLRALNPEVTDSGCISWDNFMHRRFEGEWTETEKANHTAETGPEIKDREPFDELADVDGGDLEPEEYEYIHGTDGKIFISGAGFEYTAPQIQITEEQTPGEAALEALGNVAAVFKEYFDSVLPVLEDVAQHIKGIYEIMEAEAMTDE